MSKTLCKVLFTDSPGSNQIVRPRLDNDQTALSPGRNKIVKCPTQGEWKLVKSPSLARTTPSPGFSLIIGGGWGEAGGRLPPPPPPFFCRWYFLTCERPAFQTKSRKQMQTCSQYSIWFIQYLFICDRKCPLSPFVPSNVVLSCLVRMADIWARLAQKEDSLSALQLTGTLWYSLSNTHTPPPIHPYPQPPPPPPHPPPHPHFLDRSAAPVERCIILALDANFNLTVSTLLFFPILLRFVQYWLCSHSGWLLLKWSAIDLGFSGAENQLLVAHFLGGITGRWSVTDLSLISATS